MLTCVVAKMARYLHMDRFEQVHDLLVLLPPPPRNGKKNRLDPGGGGGATPRVLGRQLPLPPPPFGQQLVAKAVAPRRPWAPKAPDAP